MNGGGGVITFVKSTIKVDEFKKTVDPYEKMQLKLTVNDCSLRYIAIYRAPTNNNFEKFMDDLECDLCATDLQTIIVGDINIEGQKSEKSNDRDSNKYLELLQSYNYEVTNCHQTRPASGRNIDHFITNFARTKSIKNLTIESDPTVSDHNMVISLVECPRKRPKNYQMIQREKIDLDKLESNFPGIPADFFEIDDPNLITEWISTSLKSAIKQSTVVEEFKVKHQENVCEWTSIKTLKIIEKKDKLLKKHRRRPTSEKISLELKSVSDTLKQSIRSDHCTYINRQLSTKNTKKLWHNLNTILGRNIPASEIEIETSSGRTRDKKIVANQLNNYFAKCVAELKSQSPPREPQTVEKTSMSSMVLEPATREEIELAISQLKSSSAPGHDGIKPSAFKTLNTTLTPLILHLTNSIFSTGIYPKSLKRAVVTPVHKGGSTLLTQNYRPISVLPILNKIIEKMLHKRLFNFVDKKLNLLYDHQFGFRPKSNTENAAIELTDTIMKSIDEGKIVTGVFMDLKKAFDVVDHKLMIEVLEKYGVRGIANRIFGSYLEGRTQQVKIGKVTSDQEVITSGVVQGSCLGPLLYLIFFNAIGSVDLNGKLFLFADDAVLVNVHNKNSDINSTVKNGMSPILRFFKHRMLFLNELKTNFVVFRSPQNRIQFPNKIQLNDDISIERVPGTKYLGLYMDEFLQWTEHIQQLESKISSANGALWKLRSVMPRHSKKLVYDSLIQSHLNYMSTTWGMSPWSAIKNLQINQNRALRNVYDLPYRLNRVNMYTHKVENHLPIRGLCVLGLATYVYKSSRRLTHSNLTFQTSTNSHQKNLRNKQNLRSEKSRTNYGTRRISSIGPKIFNKIPKDIKLSRHQHAFKWCLKCHLRKENFVKKCFETAFFQQFNDSAPSLEAT